MRASEFKLRLVSGVEGLIDTYFGSYTMTDKLLNTTLKVIVKQKSYLVDDVLTLFTDKDGCIDEHMIVDEYSKMLENETFILDIRNYINNDMVKGLLPDKALIIKSDDIRRMIFK
jgi:hypothetical protein